MMVVSKHFLLNVINLYSQNRQQNHTQITNHHTSITKSHLKLQNHNDKTIFVIEKYMCQRIIVFFCFITDSLLIHKITAWIAKYWKTGRFLMYVIPDMNCTFCQSSNQEVVSILAKHEVNNLLTIYIKISR